MVVGMAMSPLPETVRVLGRDAKFLVSVLVGTDWHAVRPSKDRTKHRVFNRSQVFMREQYKKERFMFWLARLIRCS